MARAAADADPRQQRQDDVLGRDAGAQRALDVDGVGFGLGLQQALAGQDVLDLAGADAEGQRAECAVGGGVAVAADDGHARLRQAQLRADDVDDAAVGAVEAEQRDAKVAAVLLQLGDLGRGHDVDDGQVQRRGGDAVVHRGHRLLRPPDGQAARPQAAECLG